MSVLSFRYNVQHYSALYQCCSNMTFFFDITDQISTLHIEFVHFINIKIMWRRFKTFSNSLKLNHFLWINFKHTSKYGMKKNVGQYFCWNYFTLTSPRWTCIKQHINHEFWQNRVFTVSFPLILIKPVFIQPFIRFNWYKKIFIFLSANWKIKTI